MDPLRHVTPWQRRVLRAVARVPKGKTITYRALARRLGRPRAYRSVGNALHCNPRMIEIPCHRVIRADGTVGGYRRGTRRKAALLRREGVIFISQRMIAPECIID